MRTRIAITLCLALSLLSLGACGKDKDKNGKPPASGLERPPGELPRPSEGLPDDLKPPKD